MRKVLLVLSLLCASVFGAAYRSARIDAGDSADGSVAAELRTIENALVAKQHNFALKVVRNLIPRVSGLQLVAPGAPDSEEEAPRVAQDASPVRPTPTSSVGTSNPQPAPVQPSVSAPEPARDLVNPTVYSKARFEELKKEIDALARPFTTIDDLWDDDDENKQKNCVAEYKAQLDRVVLWVTRNTGFFVMPEWSGLVKYLYENLIAWSVRGGMTNPLKVSIFGEGICGKKYYTVYDHVVGALETIKLKFNSRYEEEIKSLIGKVEKARESSWGGLKQ